MSSISITKSELVAELVTALDSPLVARQLMRRTKTQLFQQIAERHLTRVQARMSANRSHANYLRKSGQDVDAWLATVPADEHPERDREQSSTFAATIPGEPSDLYPSGDDDLAADVLDDTAPASVVGEHYVLDQHDPEGCG